MRIGFDITPLSRPYPPGVARACRGLFEALERRAELIVEAHAPRAGENERAWRHLRLPREIARAGLDGFHSPISAFPARGPGRRVSTVHELPWRNGVSENAGPGHRFWAQYGVGRADRVLCPTEFVRAQLVRECGGATRIVACPWGIEPEQPGLEQDRQRVLERLGLADIPFALAAGATRPKKNLSGILRALARLTDSPGGDELQLVVTGEASSSLAGDLALAAHLGLRERVHITGKIGEDGLRGLQCGARLPLVLGHSEGFGFPMLEALQAGTPLVVTANSAQAEVAGAAGFPADSRNVESMVAAMHAALRAPAAFGQTARARAEEFRWERSARIVSELWMGLA